MRRAPTSLFFLAVLASASPSAGAQSAAPSGRVLTFLAAPPAQQSADPSAALPVEPFAVRDGDALTALVRVPDDRGGARGLEVAYADGRRSIARRVASVGTWEAVRVPLRAGATVARIELVARGANGGQIAFQVDDVRVERADGSAIEVFRDDLLGGLTRVTALASSAGAVVGELAGACGPQALAAGADVGDPWAAIDLSALRALDREPDPTASAALPNGLVWTGPCVPLRFARAGERASFAAHGQRIGFDPLDGGRFYELWLAVVNTTDAEIVTRIAVQGVDRERIGFPLRIPPRGRDGYAPPEGVGYPARDFALIEVDVASTTGLASMQLPDDPRLRVLAVSIGWRRDGATDPRFRARWLARAAARPQLADADRADLEHYLANRRAGAVFGGVEGEGEAERALFDALLALDVPGFRARLAERIAAQDAASLNRKNGRIDLIATLPRADDDLGAVLADGVLPADLPVLAGDSETLAALAARDPAAFARLAERARAGSWRAFDASLGRRAAARLGADGLARAIASDRRTTRELLGLADDGGESSLARIEGDLGRIARLPQLLASAGFGSALVESLPKKLGAPFARWSSAGAEIVAIAPTVRCEGPLRLESSTWRAWTTAAARANGRPPIPVLCDVSAPAARETLALVEDFDRSEMAPDLAWKSIDEVTSAARARAQALDATAPAALDRDALHAELEALAAVRAAEREIERCSVVEALAVLDGAPAPGRVLARAWRDLVVAADLDAPAATSAATAIGERVRSATTARLARLLAASAPVGAGVPVVVIDPVPWARRSTCELPDGELRVAGPSGDLPMQPTANGGMLVEFAGAGTTPSAVLVRRDPFAETQAPSRVRLEGWRIRTDQLGIAIDPTTGRITHFATLPNPLDLLRDGGDELAWVAPGSAPEPIDRLEKIEFVERGPLRAIVRSVRSSSRARVETEIRVTAGSAGVEIRTRTELLDRGGDVVARYPVVHASTSALASVPLGTAAIPADSQRLNALDGWVAATDGAATFALIGEGGAAYRWSDRAFEVVLAEAGADSAREVEYRAFGHVGGWKGAGLDAEAHEAALEIVRVAFESAPRAAAEREPLVRIARIERDGRRTVGAASGVLPLSIEPGPDGTIEVRLLELRGEMGHVELTFAREPFGAERVDLAGRGLGELVVTGRGIDVAVAGGRFEIVRARLAP